LCEHTVCIDVSRIGNYTPLNKLMPCLQDAHRRMDYLLDWYLFSHEDIELNKKVLTWPKNMNPIFDQNDEVRIR